MFIELILKSLIHPIKFNRKQDKIDWMLAFGLQVYDIHINLVSFLCLKYKLPCDSFSALAFIFLQKIVISYCPAESLGFVLYFCRKSHVFSCEGRAEKSVKAVENLSYEEKSNEFGFFSCG